MPIMAMDEQFDSRGSAWLLARTVKKGIDGERVSEHQKAAMNNLFQLLEAYRSHRFVGAEYRLPEGEGASALSALPLAEGHVLDLRDALETAFQSVYQESNNETVEGVEAVLKSIVVASEPPSPEVRTRFSEFLSAFIENLNPAS